MSILSLVKNFINYSIEKRLSEKTQSKLLMISKKLSVMPSSKHDCVKYQDYWKQLQGKVNCLYPEVFSRINGIQSLKYIPEDVYYNKVEPILNNRAYAAAYSDKNFYERYLGDYKGLFPQTLLRVINGVLTNEYYTRLSFNDASVLLTGLEGSYIFKPTTETSGGANVTIIKVAGKQVTVFGKVVNADDFLRMIMSKYSTGCVVQEQITQDIWFDKFNKTSLNTVRLFTYRSVVNEDVHPLHAVLRFGREGSIVDNQASGGLSCGINESGLLNDFAVDKYGNVKVLKDMLGTTVHKAVPSFSDMCILAKKIAPRYYYQRLLGFDFCLDSGGKVRLLEINCKNLETNFLQMNRGPLFGEYTDEIIEYCSKNRKYIQLGIYI